MVRKSINKLTVAELKSELISLGLSKGGTKKVLVSRLRGALNSSVIEVDPSTSSPTKENDKPHPRPSTTVASQTWKRLQSSVNTLQQRVDKMHKAINCLVQTNKKLNKQLREIEEKYNELQNFSKAYPTQFSATTGASLSSNETSSSASATYQHRPFKILFLADSHGRDCSYLLRNQDNLRNFQILSIFKPAATFQQVIENIEDLTKGFSFQDYVVINGGSNNIKKSLVPAAAFDKIVSVSRCTNIIINTVPYRYDDYSLNPLIFNLNKVILNYFDQGVNKQGNNIIINDVNVYLRNYHYNNSGLHLKMSGKRRICDIITRIIGQTTNHQRNIQSPVEINKESSPSSSTYNSESTSNINSTRDATDVNISNDNTSEISELSNFPVLQTSAIVI